MPLNPKRTADPLTAIGLVHRTLVTEAQNSRRGTANTLTRSEVRGGGKKPYAQKGTGNARIGSRRTPLRPGGGVSFGPKATDWSIKINKKERRLAVATALQNAAADILVVEALKEDISLPKTSMLAALLGGWGIDPEQCVLLIVEELTSNLVLASRNLPGVILTTADRLVLSEILRAEEIIIEAGALAYVQERYA
ncbi:g8886 [Coccomyxa viridis]|uniref:Large ribosomal subunit protein uL4c n=1 Tax=Coccomyxa viridis TaxID=1274662 RepID=A0ABP1G2K8_9CHLO